MYSSINEFINLLINNFDEPIVILDNNKNVSFNNNKFNEISNKIGCIKDNLEKDEFILNDDYKCHVQKTNIENIAYVVYIHDKNKKFETIQLNDLLNIITDTPLGLIVYNKVNDKFTLTYANDKGISIINKNKSEIYSIDDLYKIDMLDIHNFYITKDNNPLNQVLKNKETVNNKIVYVYNNGQKNCYSMTIIPNFIDNGDIRNIIISFKDMNEIMDLKRNAELNEYYYKNILEKSPNGIVIIQDFDLIYFNNAIMKMLSCDNYDLINKSILHFMDDNNKNEFKKWHSLRMNGEDDGNDIEFTLTSKNGEVIYCLCSFSLVEINNKPASLCFIKDITQLKKQEKQLKNYYNELEKLVKKRTKELEFAKKEYELIADESPIGIMKISCKGKVKFLNKKIEETIGNIENISEKLNIFNDNYFYDMKLNEESDEVIQFLDLVDRKRHFKLKIKKIDINDIIIMFLDETKEKLMIPELMQLKREMFQNKQGQLNIDMN